LGNAWQFGFQYNFSFLFLLTAWLTWISATGKEKGCSFSQDLFGVPHVSEGRREDII